MKINDFRMDLRAGAAGELDMRGPSPPTGRRTRAGPARMRRAETCIALHADEQRTAPPEQVDRSGDEPEHDVCNAAWRGQADRVEELLAAGQGGGVEASSDDDGTTALGAACQNGHTDVAWVLMKAGADVNAVDDAGATPLMRATERAECEAMKLLLTKGKGVDVDRADEQGATPLNMAAQQGHLRAVAALLEDPRTDVNRPTKARPLRRTRAGARGEGGRASESRRPTGRSISALVSSDNKPCYYQ